MSCALARRGKRYKMKKAKAPSPPRKTKTSTRADRRCAVAAGCCIVWCTMVSASQSRRCSSRIAIGSSGILVCEDKPHRFVRVLQPGSIMDVFGSERHRRTDQSERVDSWKEGTAETRPSVMERGRSSGVKHCNQALVVFAIWSKVERETWCLWSSQRVSLLRRMVGRRL